MSVENMGNGYVKVGVKQEDLEASIAGLRQLKPITKGSRCKNLLHRCKI